MGVHVCWLRHRTRSKGKAWTRRMHMLKDNNKAYLVSSQKNLIYINSKPGCGFLDISFCCSNAYQASRSFGMIVINRDLPKTWSQLTVTSVNTFQTIWIHTSYKNMVNHSQEQHFNIEVSLCHCKRKMERVTITTHQHIWLLNKTCWGLNCGRSNKHRETSAKELSKCTRCLLSTELNCLILQMPKCSFTIPFWRRIVLVGNVKKLIVPARKISPKLSRFLHRTTLLRRSIERCIGQLQQLKSAQYREEPLIPKLWLKSDCDSRIWTIQIHIFWPSIETAKCKESNQHYNNEKGIIYPPTRRRPKGAASSCAQ